MNFYYLWHFISTSSCLLSVISHTLTNFVLLLKVYTFIYIGVLCTVLLCNILSLVCVHVEWLWVPPCMILKVWLYFGVDRETFFFFFLPLAHYWFGCADLLWREVWLFSNDFKIFGILKSDSCLYYPGLGWIGWSLAGCGANFRSN